MALIASTLPIGTKYATPQELLDLFAENLSVPVSETNLFVLGATAPTDQNKIWIDTSGANPLLKVYNGGWVSISVQNQFSAGLSVSGGNVRLLGQSLSIDNTGAFQNRVGVNTTTPSTTLDVAGSINASTSLSTPAITATGGTLNITGAVLTSGAITSSSSLSGTSLSLSGGAVVQSLTGTGGTPAFSINQSGAISASSATLSGNLTAATANLTGVVLTSQTLTTTATSTAANQNVSALGVAGYITVSVNGTNRKIPFYAE